ncbi:MAG: PepSY-like domain-containing protein [Prevotellaceae bacterium]|jgi:hypothetical protein|nr:PepSY-like domain-containing protein [Prevotellaceae bacterium]
MKTSVFYFTLVAAATMFLACDEEKIIQANELPAISRTFIETHFPDVEITAIVREKEGLDVDYTVYLANGFDIDFTKSGEWDDVDGHISALPESIIALLPENLPKYVAGVFPNLRIVEVNRERYGYEIGLSNEMDLKFNLSGHFIGMDD